MTSGERLILRNEELGTPTDLSEDAVRDISAALNALLADTFALYLKTKNFHWHVNGPHFRDYIRCSTSRPSRSRPALTSWRNVFARSGPQPCAPSAISPSCSGSRTTTKIS